MSIVVKSCRVRVACVVCALRAVCVCDVVGVSGGKRGSGRERTLLAGCAPLAGGRWAGRATSCAHANSAPAHKLKQ